MPKTKHRIRKRKKFNFIVFHRTAIDMNQLMSTEWKQSNGFLPSAQFHFAIAVTEIEKKWIEKVFHSVPSRNTLFHILFVSVFGSSPAIIHNQIKNKFISIVGYTITDAFIAREPLMDMFQCFRLFLCGVETTAAAATDLYLY